MVTLECFTRNTIQVCRRTARAVLSLSHVTLLRQLISKGRKHLYSCPHPNPSLRPRPYPARPPPRMCCCRGEKPLPRAVGHAAGAYPLRREPRPHTLGWQWVPGFQPKQASMELNHQYSKCGLEEFCDWAIRATR